MWAIYAHCSIGRIHIFKCGQYVYVHGSSGRIQILKALTDLNVTYNYFSCVMARAVDPDPDPRGFAVIFPP